MGMTAYTRIRGSKSRAERQALLKMLNSMLQAVESSLAEVPLHDPHGGELAVQASVIAESNVVHISSSFGARSAVPTIMPLSLEDVMDRKKHGWP